MRVLRYLPPLLRLIPRTSMTQEGIRVFGLLHSISAEGQCRILEKRLRNAFFFSPPSLIRSWLALLGVIIKLNFTSRLFLQITPKSYD